MEHTNSNQGRARDKIKIKSSLITDYSNKSIPITTKEEYKIELT